MGVLLFSTLDLRFQVLDSSVDIADHSRFGRALGCCSFELLFELGKFVSN